MAPAQSQPSFTEVDIPIHGELLARYNVVPIAIPRPDPIVGLSFLRVANGALVLSVITARQMHPFLLSGSVAIVFTHTSEYS
jgi:hypothetical protein